MTSPTVDARLYEIWQRLVVLKGDRGDREGSHSEGDDLLCEAVRLCGGDYGARIATAFEDASQDWWYA